LGDSELHAIKQVQKPEFTLSKKMKGYYHITRSHGRQTPRRHTLWTRTSWERWSAFCTLCLWQNRSWSLNLRSPST